MKQPVARARPGLQLMGDDRCGSGRPIGKPRGSMRLQCRLWLPFIALLAAGCSPDTEFEPDRVPDRLGAWLPEPSASRTLC